MILNRDTACPTEFVQAGIPDKRMLIFNCEPETRKPELFLKPFSED